MCGIVGVVARKEEARRPETIQTMMRTLYHRGPDDNGCLAIDSIVLGFQRLAILDPVTGHQPMQTKDQRYSLVFNGEIYNFAKLRRELETTILSPFVTGSDTEVLLQAYAAWGVEAFERLNGMFALAIWDSHEKSLTIARDRCGEKPLYYHNSSSCFLFASEVKALLAHSDCPRRVSPDRIATSLAYRYIPDAELAFDGIEALIPGHWMRIDACGNIVEQPTRFWAGLPDCKVHNTKSIATLISSLTDLLQESVNQRLIADVPVGALLSGGVDSSLLVALMSKSISGFKTFSIGFNEGVTEHRQAAEVAEIYGTDHHEILIGPKDILRGIPRALWHRESPIAEPSDIPLYILARYASEHVKVVLSGEGCDELFGGYPKYVAEHHMRNVPAWIRQRTGQLFQKLIPAGKSSRWSIASGSMAEAEPVESAARWFGAFSKYDRWRLLSPEMQKYNRSRQGKAIAATLDSNKLSRMQLMQALDFHHWLPANLLLRGDRMTMANSLEMRCPYLDPEIINFAFKSLPDNLKIRGFSSKWILRQVARQVLPQYVAVRRKWGFKVPVGEWMRNEMQESLRQTLLSPEAWRRGYYQMNEVERMLKEHIDDNRDHSKQLWYLWQLELWHLMFIDNIRPGV